MYSVASSVTNASELRVGVGVGVASVGRGVPTVAIVRFSESSAIR